MADAKHTARRLIENTDPDSPESFGVAKHLDSPVARIAATNGFKLSRVSNEERWVKELSNGKEVWLRTISSREYELPMDFQKGRGGREWELVEYTKVNGRYTNPKLLIRTNEVAMSYVLGAHLQRLATWPADMPKPTLENVSVPDPDDPATAVSSFVKSKTPYFPDYAKLANYIANNRENVYINGKITRHGRYVHENSTTFELNIESNDLPDEIAVLANVVEKQIGEELVRINKKIYRALEREWDHRNSDEYIDEWLGEQDDIYNELGNHWDGDDDIDEPQLTYAELSDGAKSQARDNYRQGSYDQGWEDHILEEWQTELEDMGFSEPDISYSGFSSQGDGASFTSNHFDFMKWVEWHMSNKPVERGHPYTDDLPVKESLDEPSKEQLIHMGRAGKCDQHCQHCGAYCTLIHYDLNGTQMPQYHICQTCDSPLTEIGLNNDKHVTESSYNFPDQGEQDKPEHWADDPEPDVDDPTAMLKQEVAKRSEPIKKLHIYGRRWYRRGAGGVYCKAYIYINDKLVHVTPEQYGYNDHYLTLATDWLRREGYLEGLLAPNEPIWYLRDKKIVPDLMYYVTDVKRERDL